MIFFSGIFCELKVTGAWNADQRGKLDSRIWSCWIFCSGRVGELHCSIVDVGIRERGLREIWVCQLFRNLLFACCVE